MRAFDCEIGATFRAFGQGTSLRLHVLATGARYAEYPSALRRIDIRSQLLEPSQLCRRVEQHRMSSLLRIPYGVKLSTLSGYHVSTRWLSCEAYLIFPCGSI